MKATIIILGKSFTIELVSKVLNIFHNVKINLILRRQKYL